ncbi:MAG: hypothetical protein ABIW96_05760 [Polaromonas sp.]
MAPPPLDAIAAAAHPPRLTLAMVEGSIPAGFPSPADDFPLKGLDLNDLLITHPLATFFMQVSGWSVVLERTVRELQGQICLQLESQAPPKQEIACTRSFGHPVTELADLIKAVSHFASRAAHKLRAQAGQAGQVLVFIHTSAFRRQDRQYSRSITVPLRRPSSDSRAIVQAARARLAAHLQGQVLLRQGWRDAARPAGRQRRAAGAGAWR